MRVRAARNIRIVKLPSSRVQHQCPMRSAWYGPPRSRVACAVCSRSWGSTLRAMWCTWGSVLVRRLGGLAALLYAWRTLGSGGLPHSRRWAMAARTSSALEMSSPKTRVLSVAAATTAGRMDSFTYASTFSVQADSTFFRISFDMTFDEDAVAPAAAAFRLHELLSRGAQQPRRWLTPDIPTKPGLGDIESVDVGSALATNDVQPPIRLRYFQNAQQHRTGLRSNGPES